MIAADLDHLLRPGGVRLAFAERAADHSLGAFVPLGHVVPESLDVTDDHRERLILDTNGRRRVAERVLGPQGGRLRVACESITAHSLRLFLLGEAVSPAAAGQETVTREAVYLAGTTPWPLMQPPAGAVTAVESRDLGAAYDPATVVVDADAGTLTRAAGAPYADPAWLAVSYPRAVPAHDRFAVGGRVRIPGAARLVLPPGDGPGLFWDMPRVAVGPAAPWSLAPAEDSPARLLFDVHLEPDPDTPGAPFGILEIWPGA